MRRREFITLLGGVAVAWPVGARAQQPDRLRLIGVLTGVAGDPMPRARDAVFVRGLQELGWVDGRNIRMGYRWGGGGGGTICPHSAALVGRTPEAVFSICGARTERVL